MDSVMPIMKHDDAEHCPDSIPFSVLNERQAYENHSQTLTRLADRGGLSACEAVAIAEGRYWHRMKPQAAVDRLNEIIKAH